MKPKPAQELIHIGCKIPPDLWKRIKIAAISTGTPIYVFVRQALEAYLSAVEDRHSLEGTARQEHPSPTTAGGNARIKPN